MGVPLFVVVFFAGGGLCLWVVLSGAKQTDWKLQQLQNWKVPSAPEEKPAWSEC